MSKYSLHLPERDTLFHIAGSSHRLQIQAVFL